jgi:thiol-disulfide isomerase/thioredoxin
VLKRVFALVSGLLLFAPALCVAQYRVGNISIKVGDPAPEIRLMELIPSQSVSNATLRALKWKAVVIELWATWCGPCVQSIPHFNGLVSQFANKQIQFISITAEDRLTVENFLKKRPIKGWIGLDYGSEQNLRLPRIAQAYGFSEVPHVILVDANGRFAGAMHPSLLNARHLNDLLSGKIPDLSPSRETQIEDHFERAQPGQKLRPTATTDPVFDAVRMPDGRINMGDLVPVMTQLSNLPYIEHKPKNGHPVIEWSLSAFNVAIDSKGYLIAAEHIERPKERKDDIEPALNLLKTQWRFRALGKPYVIQVRVINHPPYDLIDQKLKEFNKRKEGLSSLSIVAISASIGAILLITFLAFRLHQKRADIARFD